MKPSQNQMSEQDGRTIRPTKSFPISSTANAKQVVGDAVYDIPSFRREWLVICAVK
jgi:hypothetical protein